MPLRQNPTCRHRAHKRMWLSKVLYDLYYPLRWWIASLRLWKTDSKWFLTLVKGKYQFSWSSNKAESDIHPLLLGLCGLLLDSIFRLRTWTGYRVCSRKHRRAKVRINSYLAPKAWAEWSSHQNKIRRQFYAENQRACQARVHTYGIWRDRCASGVLRPKHGHHLPNVWRDVPVKFAEWYLIPTGVSLKASVALGWIVWL